MGRRNRKAIRNARALRDSELSPEEIANEFAGDLPEEVAARHRPDEIPPNARGPEGSAGGERHAVGDITGGTSVGGLGGSNMGDGTPNPDELDSAVGSDDFDHQFDSDQEDAYAGRAGGAVGGTPANKRVRGGSDTRPTR